MADASIRPSQKGSVTSTWLLFSLLLSLLAMPLFEGLYGGRVLLLLGLTLTFIVGTMTSRFRLRIIALALLVMALPTAWATLFVQSKFLFVTHCLIASTFFWFVGGVLVFLAAKTFYVTFDSVIDAISAYLLFGLAWSLAYWAIYTMAPDSLSFPDEQTSTHSTEIAYDVRFSQFVYYSFVTMSTLGYGDITPSGRITRTLSWMQSIIGQFYVAVLIAWLVSALPRPGKETQ